jgi:hypothetical protein
MTEPTADLASLRRSLEWWWCNKYTRPMKDPLLLQYSTEELALEFLINLYSMPEHDPKKAAEEAQSEKDDQDWIQKQMQSTRKTPPKDPEPPVQPDQPPTPDLPEISATFDP